MKNIKRNGVINRMIKKLNFLSMLKNMKPYKLTIIILTFIFTIILISLLAIALHKNPTVFYLGDSGSTLYYVKPGRNPQILLNNCLTVDIKSNYNQTKTYFCADTLDGKKSLYYLSSNRKPKLIAESIIKYDVSRDNFNRVFYTTTNNNNTVDFYMVEYGRKKYSIATYSSVYDFSVSINGKYVSYLDQQSDLYMSNGKEKGIKIWTNVSLIKNSPYSRQCYFITKDKALYYSNTGKTPIKIHDKVDSIQGITSNAKSCVFYTAESDIYTFIKGKSIYQVDKSCSLPIKFVDLDRNDVPKSVKFTYIKGENAYFNYNGTQKSKIGNMVTEICYDKKDRGFYFIEGNNEVYYAKLTLLNRVKDKIKITDGATNLVSNNKNNVVGFISSTNLISLSKSKPGKQLASDVSENVFVRGNGNYIYLYTNFSSTNNSYSLSMLNAKNNKLTLVDHDVSLPKIKNLNIAYGRMDYLAYFKAYTEGKGSLYIFAGSGKSKKVSENVATLYS